MRVFGCFLLMFFLIYPGCGPAGIDTSSEEMMKRSIERIRGDLPEGERRRFDKALEDIDAILFDPSVAVTQATIGFSRPEMLLRKILDNKSAEEVISMVEDYKKKHGLLEYR